MRYDLEERSWLAGPNLPRPAYGLTLTATNQALYAIGGFSDNDVLTPTAQVTRPPLTGTFSFNAWTIVDPLPRTLGWPSAACAPANAGVILASVGGTSFPTTSPGWTGGVWHTLRRASLPRWATPAAGSPASPCRRRRSRPTPGPPDAPTRHTSCTTSTRTTRGELWSLDTRNSFWTRLADSTVQNAGLACGPGGKLHAIGDYGSTATYHVYRPRHERVVGRAAPPQPTFTTAVGAYGTKVVTVGTTHTDPAKTVAQVYDTVTRTWTVGPALPAPLLGTESIQAGKYLYIVGGVDYTRGDGVHPDVWRRI